MQIKKMSKVKKAIKIISLIIGAILLFLISSNYIWINERETLFYKMEQYLTYDEEDWKNHEEFMRELPPISNSNTIETSEAVSEADYYPFDTNRLTGIEKKNELERIKNAHFEKLIVSKKQPTDEEAQTALVRFTEGRLADVIINQKINIKIGKCYENSNTDGNYKCVSCMILLYNRDKKDWQEAPDGENFLDNSYDFYQASEGDFWEAKKLSMMIPFDYELIKKFEPK